MNDKTKAFREQLKKLSREDLLEIIKNQDIEIYKQVNRIEWVFRNKLSHVNWNSGLPVLDRDMTYSKRSSCLVKTFFKSRTKSISNINIKTSFPKKGVESWSSSR